MFNLIVVGFSIALVTLLSVAALYYGGEAVVTRKIDTEYARTTNEATQIRSAIDLYRARTGSLPNTEDTAEILRLLKAEGFLSTIPSGDWTISMANLSMSQPITNERSCGRINELSGMPISEVPDGSGCPLCSDSEFLTWPACKIPAPD